MRHAILRTTSAVLALLVVSGCSDDGAPDGEAAISSGDPSACPGEVLDVVVSVGAWSDVVRRLGGDCATVTTIAPAADAPAEGAPADGPAFAAADLAVVNGARFDAWATDAIDAVPNGPVVVNAAEVAGVEGQGGDPQLWNDPAVVPEVAAAVALELARLSPDAAPYFDAQHTAWTTELQPWLEAVATFGTSARGHTFAATGPAIGRLAGAVGLTDVTPPGYARGARAGDEPSPGELAEFEAALRDGSVDVLVQVGDDAPDGLRDAAGDADLPVAEVTASPAEDASFVEWQLAQLGALADALAEDG